MIYSHLSDFDLLKKLIGVRETKRIYKGSLDPLFCGSDDSAQSPERCVIARELVKRWLREDLQRGCAFSQPAKVREFLQAHYRGQEYESFVTLFLDAQNRLIACDELFRGTLTQTAVYPREIVKAALKHNSAAVIFAHN